MRLKRTLTVLTTATILLVGTACGSDIPEHEALATPVDTPVGFGPTPTTAAPYAPVDQTAGLWNDAALLAVAQAKEHFGPSFFGVRIDPQYKRLTVSTFGKVSVDFPAEFNGVQVDYVVAQRSPAEAAMVAQELQAQASAAYAPAASPVGVSPDDLSGGVVITTPKMPTQQDQAYAESLVAQATQAGVAAELRALDYDNVQPAN